MSARIGPLTLSNGILPALQNNLDNGTNSDEIAKTVITADQSSDSGDTPNVTTTEQVLGRQEEITALARLQGELVEGYPLVTNYREPKKVVLPNGLTIIAEKIPGAVSCYVSVWVNTGSMYEEADNNGVAHFVEHMVFKGTDKRSNIDIKKEIQRLGNDVNAFTDQEHTCYHARVLSKYVPGTLDLFFDMLLNSKFDEKELENQRKVILEEIKMYKDSPEDHIDDLLYSTIWKWHPMGRPVIGTTQIISDMKRDTLATFLHDFYTPDNMTISIAGEFNLDEVLTQAEKLTSQVKRTKKKIELPELNVTPSIVIKNKQIEQTHLIFATEGVSVKDKRRYALNVIDTALCGGFNSRLFDEIRDKRGLAYTVSSETEYNPLGGIFGIYTAIPGEDISCVLDIILKELKDVKENGLEVMELEMAKRQLINELIMEHELAEDIVAGNVLEDLYHSRFIPISEAIEAVKSVSNDDVIKLANEIFDPKYFTLIVLGPKKELPKDFKLTFKQSKDLIV